MKSFRYAGGCLVCCPRFRESGVLTGGLLSSTGGVTGLLVTGVSLFCSSLISLDGAPSSGGFALPDPFQVPGVMALGLALEMADALLLMEVVFHLLPSPLPAAPPLHTWSVSPSPTRCCPPPGLQQRGGFSHCIRAGPIRFQASLILDRHLS